MRGITGTKQLVKLCIFTELDKVADQLTRLGRLASSLSLAYILLHPSDRSVSHFYKAGVR